MFSEQFFDILLNFGDSWIIDDVKVNFKWFYHDLCGNVKFAIK